MRAISKPGSQKSDVPVKKPNTLAEIQRLQRERDERRRNMEQAKMERNLEEQRNRESGNPGDVDFQRMIRQYRENAPRELQHSPPGEMKICICVRKRPISSKEIKRNDFDSVTCLNPQVIIHDCKLKVDGISKYLENASFEVDHSFHEENTTEELYYYTVKPLVPFALRGGRSTVFAYGQTGSGKTFTMQGIQSMLADELFRHIYTNPDFQNIQVQVSFFEIYGGRCQDLLNNREKLNVREDGNGEVVVSELMEATAGTVEELQAIIDDGNSNRTTHATESNDVSSRSHAICLILLKNAYTGKLVGKISLIDLAGSERGCDTKSHNRQRRMEGSEINKSLLALKECIRALDSGSNHVPYRASKLTLVLKDSFTSKNARTVMIANISPAASSADHTLNTLRYADRVKEKSVGSQAAAKHPVANQYNNNYGPPPNAAIAKMVDDTPSFDDDFSMEIERDILAYKEVDEQEDELVDEFHNTIQDIFEKEEELLNLHMNVIQENAELLTEEGRLLQQIQGDDYDIDFYATRLDTILKRKEELINALKDKLSVFRKQLVKEEMTSKQIAGKIKSY